MSLQKYRADRMGQTQSDGAVPWFSQGISGGGLALIRNCPTLWGRRTVYVRGEMTTIFSLPAACEIRVKRIDVFTGAKITNRQTIKGYITTNNHGEYIFRAYHRDMTLYLGA